MGRDFKNIKAWKHADALALAIYTDTKSFPREELYGIVSQLRRAAISAPANIAEGASRKHEKEYLNFLYIAKGSLAEIEYLFHISKQLAYLNEEKYIKLEKLRMEAAKTLSGLIDAVDK